MKKIRIVPRLDVKGPNVVKGIQLEGLRVIGNPAKLAKKYYDEGADEILYIDIVASLYERNNLTDVVVETAESGVFIPVTVGGGIRSIEDVKKLLRSGADKVAINTAATRNPEIITEAAKIFGSQCIVGSIEAKYQGNGKWEAYVDNGREKTGLDAIEWAKKLESLGAGEILVTSVDRDGVQKGFDTELIKRISEVVSVPVVACGGAGKKEDIISCINGSNCDAVAFASILHYNKTTIGEVKHELERNGIPVRKILHEKKSTINSEKHKKTINIVDYGAGNLKSVITAFKTMGNPVKIISTPEEIESSELLVLPGDGAFGYGMDELKRRHLIEPIKKHAAKGLPLLGICLGMQLLMTESEEFGHHLGLNLIEGKVMKLKDKSVVDDDNYSIPHMGWNELVRPAHTEWRGTMLENIPDRSEVYFVHSYCVFPENKKYSLANTIYGKQEFCTVIRKDNIFGTQFHPEKSGSVGIEMVRYFSDL